VFLSQKTLFKLPEIGQNLKLFCFLDVGENKMDLYGFLDQKELEFFEILNNIRGVGPKTALELSSFGPLEKIKERILSQDENLFSGIPGIGKKKAMAIILELTGKIKSGLNPKKQEQTDEVSDALLNLGFSRQRIKEVLAKIPKEIKDPEVKIKEALKLLT
jgi:Holliday junction DNA helicase RuvA